ncbi:hypothetical protein CFK38_05345 [Brachybacterium vulturis]|uniref:Uncharacterized protein n=1 Tax=Brachybacterium vulturis TaxID=2017484 RepID=A0A291GLD4_9MICO|nr:hypothetical protein [Brachybacterium vulturis]ATG51017.1 hypothetical protein CFK38_05345 [Brachybacterium vulturis]
MTQGYGPDHGQQGQWGQDPPEGAPAPSADATAPVGLIRWLFVIGIAVVTVRALLVLVSILLSVYFYGLASTATDTDDVMISFGVGSIVISAGQLVTVVLSVALLTLAIIVAVKARERGRTGAIIVGGAVVLSFVIFVLVFFIGRFLFINAPGVAGDGVDGIFRIAIIDHVVQAVHWLVFSAAVLIGAVRARRWARQIT